MAAVGFMGEGADHKPNSSLIMSVIQNIDRNTSHSVRFGDQACENLRNAC